ncbi:MAG: hypothetical protein ACI86M_003972 [Saprospiraceae bacterium]|jgi:hypothetical protein
MFRIPDSIPKNDLPDALDQAIALEIATIPTYLYTYYSLKRSWMQKPGEDAPASSKKKYAEAYTKDQELSIKSDSNPSPNAIKLATGEGLQYFIMTNATCEMSSQEAKDLAIEIQVYANKAAGLIMSVAVEEMLHTALSSNVKQSLFGKIEILNLIPAFPTAVPGHEPPLPINEAKFSQEQLITFLRIESPKAYIGQDEYSKSYIESRTIGQFYEMIENCIKDHYSDCSNYDTSRPQLLPGKGYYGPNSIDTVFYDKNHTPQFPSDDDSGDLVHVHNMDSALHALDEIVEQGEGSSSENHLTKDGNPICPNVDWDNPDEKEGKDWDDKKKTELSHFDKFLEAYCLGEKLLYQFNEVGLDFHSFFVFNLPTNPTNYPRQEASTFVNYAEAKMVNPTLPYPINSLIPNPSTEPLINVSNVTNAINTYIFLMIEACYYQKGHTQYEIFMFGIHKGMIWALSVLCYTMSMYEIEFQGKNSNAAATFEPYDFGTSQDSPKKQIQDLIKIITDEFDSIPGYTYPGGNALDIRWVSEYVDNFPDVTLDHKVLATV